MNEQIILETQRLYFRSWKLNQIDRDVFHEINSDEELMRFYPFRRTREYNDALVEKMKNEFDISGLGWGAICLKGSDEPIGFAGLSTVKFDAHFVPATEIGWRLIRRHWGDGYATEIADGLLEFGFNNLHLHEIVAFAVYNNSASIAVMKRLGMVHSARDDFQMPNIEVPYQHLRHHVLYRMTKADWQKKRGE